MKKTSRTLYVVRSHRRPGVVPSLFGTLACAGLLLLSPGALAQEDAEAPAEGESAAATAEAAASAPSEVGEEGEAAGETADEEAAEAAGDPETEAGESQEAEADASVDATGEGVVVDSEVSLFGSAMEEEIAGDEGGGGGGFSAFDLNGYTRGDVFVGKQPGGSAAMLKAAYGEMALKLNASAGSAGGGFAETRLRYGLQQGKAAPELITDLREAYANVYMGPVDLRLGHQIIVWGKADALNPTNNLTPFDLSVRSPLEDDRRLGNLAARAHVNFQPLRLELVWVPVYAHTRVPNLNIPLVMLEEKQPEPSVEDSLAAARLHLVFQSIEMSASYVYGYAPMAGLIPSEVVWGYDTPFRVLRVPYKHQVLGFDFSTALGEFMTLRGEAAYRMPEDYTSSVNTPRPDLIFTVGGDKAFGNVSVIAQYLGRYTRAWADDSAPATDDRPQSVPYVFDPDAETRARADQQFLLEVIERNQILFQQLAELQHLAILRLEWLTLHETLSLSAQGMFNFTTEEWMAHPKLTYSFSDRISGTLGAEIFAGPDDTLLGLIDADMSAGYTELRVSF